MNKWLLIIAFGSLSFTQAEARTRIEIDSDKSDCVDGKMSMDVTVGVGNQDFDFDPSCKFSFDENFKTESGLECEIHAGMCSPFSPKNKIEVKCADGGFKSVDVLCATKK